MAETSIRRAKLADRDQYVGLAAELFAEDAIPRDNTLDQRWPHTFVPDSFTAGIDDPSRLLLVAVNGDSLIGSLSGSLAEPTAMRAVTVATLVSVYVKPGFRVNGVGAALVSRFKDWARETGAARIAVTAYHDNGAAIRFYQREGFIPYQFRLETDLV